MADEHNIPRRRFLCMYEDYPDCHVCPARFPTGIERREHYLNRHAVVPTPPQLLPVRRVAA
jgi:hypothetical protein